MIATTPASSRSECKPTVPWRTRLPHWCLHARESNRSHQRRNKNIFYFQPYLCSPPCSSHPLTLFSLFKHISLSSASLPLPVWIVVVVSSPHSSSLFHSALLIPPTIFSLVQRRHFNLGVGGWGGCLCVCVFLCTILYVCMRVCEIGEGQERERKKEVNICVYFVAAWARVGLFFFACVCLCMWGRWSKGVYPPLKFMRVSFLGPPLQGRGSLSFFFSHSNASYTLCETPLNAEKMGRVEWAIDVSVLQL